MCSKTSKWFSCWRLFLPVLFTPTNIYFVLSYPPWFSFSISCSAYDFAPFSCYFPLSFVHQHHLCLTCIVIPSPSSTLSLFVCCLLYKFILFWKSSIASSLSSFVVTMHLLLLWRHSLALTPLVSPSLSKRLLPYPVSFAWSHPALFRRMSFTCFLRLEPFVPFMQPRMRFEVKWGDVFSSHYSPALLKGKHYQGHNRLGIASSPRITSHHPSRVPRGSFTPGSILLLHFFLDVSTSWSH